MSRVACLILGALVASLNLAGVQSSPYYGGGFGGFGGYGYGGYGGVGVVEEIVEPVIPVGSGLVDARSFTDSYIPGSSYCGYGTYGPAYGGRPYPLDVYGLEPYHHAIIGNAYGRYL